MPDIVVPRGVTPFYLPRRPVRGRLVRLGPLADALLTRHDNPPSSPRLAGQALALVAALASALKFRGSFSLQAKGDGPVGMLLADCTDDGRAARLRARRRDERLADRCWSRSRAGRRAHCSAPATWPSPSTRGRTPTATRASSASRAASLADMALHYFATSEQLALRGPPGLRAAPGGLARRALILERIAGAGGVDPELDAGGAGGKLAHRRRRSPPRVTDCGIAR